MAEGIQLNSLNTKFYCYRCEQDITLLSPSELKCPECSSGFIEEVQDEYDEESDIDESELSMFNLFNVENLLRRTVVNLGEVDSRLAQETNDESDSAEDRHLEGLHYLRRYAQELEGTIITPPDTSLRNLGNYLFGDDIDALSTLLMNEAEISGPPPLSQSQIKILPVITVSKEHVEKGLQCTICMEDFAVRDKAKSLPCDHFYHERCITPWLERHATCPNCRKTVEVVETQLKNRSQSRSQSCPRSFSSESVDSDSVSSGSRRLFAETRSSLGTIFTASMNPFRFL